MMMEATMAKPMNTALATNIEIPLTITAKNQSKKNIYVDKIVFEMSSTPDK